MLNSNASISIQVSAPEHSGKTSLIVLLYKHLQSLGADVVLQKADPQLDNKLGLEHDLLVDRLKNTKVIIKEMQTYK